MSTETKPAATLDELHVRLSKLAEEAKVIENTADAEKRSMTEEEVKHLKSLNAQFQAIEAELDVRNANRAMEAKLATPGRRVTEPADVEPKAEARPAQTITGGLPSGTTKGSYGFRSIGEWAIAARKTRFGNPDQRIVNVPTSFGSEGTNADGGFAVPPDFRAEIMKQVMSEESLLSRCDVQTTSSNALSLPLDSTTPWQTSGGVLVNWTGEGTAISESKPSFGKLNIPVHKLAAMVPLTEELMEDVPAMTRWLTTKVPEKFTSELNNVIISGNGVAKPQGLLSAPALVTQDAESGQGASTIVVKNILKMWGRMYAPCRARAVWLINQDSEQQLQQLTMPATNPYQAVYVPPGGLSASPYSTLLGRPIIPIEACSALGTEGDIILADLSQYCIVMKAGGIRQDVSIHLYFDSDHTTFRFIMRVGGQSYWPSTIARKNGSNTLSPIITLNSSRT